MENGSKMPVSDFDNSKNSDSVMMNSGSENYNNLNNNYSDYINHLLDDRLEKSKLYTTMTTTISSSTAITTGFYKFLARFSGRRRFTRNHYHTIVFYCTLILILSTFCNKTDACSSRTTPKPRPPTPTPRPNITFHTYKCPPAYADWYCLNEATCFTVKIGDSLLYNCECADGYMGPRCEYKNLDGSYLPTRPRVMLGKASVASGVAVALVLAIVVAFTLYVWRHKKTKLKELELNGDLNGGASTMTGLDTVDGGWSRSYTTTAAMMNQTQQQQQHPLHPSHYNTVGCAKPKRPFGPHHHRTIPMSEALQR